MPEWVLILAGVALGALVVVPVLAGYGAAHGCPWCKGYCGMWGR